jgi:hypothetical protein
MDSNRMQVVELQTLLKAQLGIWVRLQLGVGKKILLFSEKKLTTCYPLYKHSSLQAFV